MCGYAGVFSATRNLREDFTTVLSTVGKTICHRGPDASGVWFDATAGVGMVHRRLAIQDLSPSGAQPMSSPSGRYVIAFNGEIYNFQALRRVLHGCGLTFNGHSDTEVMLAAFDVWGVDKALEEFSGMFSFALLDRQEDQLVLARDRMGEKPLYYGWVQGNFVFASELKALQAFPFWRGEINRDALTLLLRHNYIPSPHSIYKNIFKLPAATYLRVDLLSSQPESHCNPVPYWSLSNCFEYTESVFESRVKAADHLDGLLRDVIGEQMVADVPLGAFLSGGVDSSTIAAIMQQLSCSKVKTFSIGFKEQAFNEAEYAKAVAAHLGTEHTELYVTANDALQIIPRLPLLYDEPFADSSQIPTYLVAEMTRRHVTVALSGDGGDELFCGYDRYFSTSSAWQQQLSGRKNVVSRAFNRIVRNNHGDLARLIKWFVPSQRQFSVAEIVDKLQRRQLLMEAESVHEFYRRKISYWSYPEQVVIDSKEPYYSMMLKAPQEVGEGVYKQLMWQDLCCYLPDDILVKVDRAAMACSLETRIPLLDRRVVEFALQLPLYLNVDGNQGKQVLRDVLYRYVPKGLVDRKKSGFAVPVGAWLRTELREWAECLLDSSRLDAEGIWNVELIRRKWNDHCAGRGDHAFHLWGVLMFQAWHEHQGSKQNGVKNDLSCCCAAADAQTG